MNAGTFERVRAILFDHGWNYYPQDDIWTTQKEIFNGVSLTNEALIAIMETDNPRSIGLFFTHIIKRPDILKDIFELLPDNFFGKSVICA